MLARESVVEIRSSIDFGVNYIFSLVDINGRYGTHCIAFGESYALQFLSVCSLACVSELAQRETERVVYGSQRNYCKFATIRRYIS
jgi:hypothetical protein